jgi:hypothetical protein
MRNICYGSACPWCRTSESVERGLFTRLSPFAAPSSSQGGQIGVLQALPSASINCTLAVIRRDKRRDQYGDDRKRNLVLNPRARRSSSARGERSKGER